MSGWLDNDINEVYDLIALHEHQMLNEAVRFIRPYESRLRPGVYPQLEIWADSHKIRAIGAGNRAGKTMTMLFDAICTIEKRHPFWDPVEGCAKALPPETSALDMFPVDFDKPVPYKQPIRARLCTLDHDFAKDVHIPLLQSMVVKKNLKGGSWESAWREADKKLIWADNSYLQFRSFESDETKFGGSTLHWVGHDELCKNYQIWVQNMARTMESKGRLMIVLTPIKGRNVWEYRKLFAKRKSNPDISIHSISVAENPYIPDDEVKKMAFGLSADDRKIIIDGEFISKGGLVYGGFDPKSHVVTPFDIPRGWPRFLLCDPHVRKPTMFIWAAVSPDPKPFQRYYIYRELATSRPIPEQCNMVKALSAGERLSMCWCDSKMNITNNLIEGSINYYEEYAQSGLVFDPAPNTPNSKEPGIRKVKDYLKREFVSGTPRLMFFAGCFEHDHDIKDMDTIEGSRAAWECNNYSYRKPDQTDSEIHRELTVDVDDDAITLVRYLVMIEPDITFGLGNGLDSAKVDAFIKPDGSIVFPNDIQDQFLYNEKNFLGNYHD